MNATAPAIPAVGLSAGPGDVPPRRSRVSEKPDVAGAFAAHPLRNEGCATVTTLRDPATARTGPPVGPAVAALMRRGLDRHQAGLVAQRDREAWSRRFAAARMRVRVAEDVQRLRDYLQSLAERPGGGGTGLSAEIARFDDWLNRHRETLT